MKQRKIATRRIYFRVNRVESTPLPTTYQDTGDPGICSVGCCNASWCQDLWPIPIIPKSAESGCGMWAGAVARSGGHVARVIPSPRFTGAARAGKIGAEGYLELHSASTHHPGATVSQCDSKQARVRSRLHHTTTCDVRRSESRLGGAIAAWRLAHAQRCERGPEAAGGGRG
jgi:hypothetical protein